MQSTRRGTAPASTTAYIYKLKTFSWKKYLSKLIVVSGNVTKSPGGCFLYTRIEFFKADDESIKGATVDNLK